MADEKQPGITKQTWEKDIAPNDSGDEILKRTLKPPQTTSKEHHMVDTRETLSGEGDALEEATQKIIDEARAKKKS